MGGIINEMKIIFILCSHLYFKLITLAVEDKYIAKMQKWKYAVY